jgi:hypothetical protein
MNNYYIHNKIGILFLLTIINISFCFSFIPSNESYLNITTPHFVWTYDNDEYTNYSLLISTNSNIASPVYTRNNITITNHTITSNLNDNTYYWRIDVYVNNTFNESLEINQFIIDTIPPNFTHHTPSSIRYDNDNTLNITLTIIEQNLNQTPQCQYRLNSNPYSALQSMSLISGTTYIYSINEDWQNHEGKTLYYRCIAKDYANNIANETRTISIQTNTHAPIFKTINNMTAIENTNHTFIISATDTNNDYLIFSSNLTTLNFQRINSTSVRAYWIPQQQHIGKNIIKLTAYDGKHYTNKTIEIFVDPEDKSPILEPIGNLEAYLHQPLIKYFKGYYDYPKQNETLNLYYLTTPNLAWFKIITMYNFSDNSYIGKINFTPLLSHIGYHNITIILKDDEDNMAKENILFRVGYCGDKDLAGEPICDARYENCENCPKDCGPCNIEQEDAIGIITQQRNCLYSNFTLTTYKLYERATCENIGKIIDDMEICKELGGTTIIIYQLENKKWVEKEKYITDLNGKLTFIPESQGSFKIDAEYINHKKATIYIDFKECIDIKKETNKTNNQTIQNNITINKSIENKKPITDLPTIIEDEEIINKIENATTLKTIIYYVIIPTLILMLITLGIFYYQKEKNNNKYILKFRIKIITYKKQIIPKINRYWIKTKDILGF